MLHTSSNERLHGKGGQLELLPVYIGTETILGSNTSQAVATFKNMSSFSLLAGIFPECHNSSLVNPAYTPLLSSPTSHNFFRVADRCWRQLKLVPLAYAAAYSDEPHPHALDPNRMVKSASSITIRFVVDCCRLIAVVATCNFSRICHVLHIVVVVNWGAQERNGRLVDKVMKLGCICTSSPLVTGQLKRGLDAQLTRLEQ